MNPKIPLFGDYSYQLTDRATHKEIRKQYNAEVFSSSIIFASHSVYTPEEIAKQSPLFDRIKDIYRLYLLVYHKDEVIGWHSGQQDSIIPNKFYMANSGIRPQFQGQGIYKSLLQEILKIVHNEGFEEIYSIHSVQNNAILVPKLKAGFIISGFDISDRFGLTVKLSYWFHPLRREVVDFRLGERLQSEELKSQLNIWKEKS